MMATRSCHGVADQAGKPFLGGGDGLLGVGLRAAGPLADDQGVLSRALGRERGLGLDVLAIDDERVDLAEVLAEPGDGLVEGAVELRHRAVLRVAPEGVLVLEAVEARLDVGHGRAVLADGHGVQGNGGEGQRLGHGRRERPPPDNGCSAGGKGQDPRLGWHA
jgi:hypothetical protein